MPASRIRMYTWLHIYRWFHIYRWLLVYLVIYLLDKRNPRNPMTVFSRIKWICKLRYWDWRSKRFPINTIDAKKKQIAVVRVLDLFWGTKKLEKARLESDLAEWWEELCEWENQIHLLEQERSNWKKKIWKGDVDKVDSEKKLMDFETELQIADNDVRDFLFELECYLFNNFPELF